MGVADKLAILMTLSSAPPAGGYNPMDLPPTASDVTIAGQNGGSVRAHVSQVVDYDRAGTHLRVTGACVSACTLILALPPDRICVGPNARFGFHQPFTGGGRNEHHQSDMPLTGLGSAMIDAYPPFVQRWLKANYGGLPTGRPQFMGYDVLKAYYPTCG
jgi:hypothetical protein